MPTTHPLTVFDAVAYLCWPFSVLMNPGNISVDQHLHHMLIDCRNVQRTHLTHPSSTYTFSVYPYPYTSAMHIKYVQGDRFHKGNIPTSEHICMYCKCLPNISLITHIVIAIIIIIISQAHISMRNISTLTCAMLCVCFVYRLACVMYECECVCNHSHLAGGLSQISHQMYV